MGLDPSPPFPSRNNPETSPTPTPNYYFEGARSGDRKGEGGEKSETEDNPKGLTLPDDSTQLIIISLSVCLSLRLVSESGSGFWQRRPRGERLEVTAWAAAAFFSLCARSGGLRAFSVLGGTGPRGSGRASSRASGGTSRQPPQPPSPQPFLLSRTGLLPEGVKGSFSPLSPPPLPSPPPLARVPLRRSPPFPLLLLPPPPPTPLPPHHHNNHLGTEDTLTQDLKH